MVSYSEPGKFRAVDCELYSILFKWEVIKRKAVIILLHKPFPESPEKLHWYLTIKCKYGGKNPCFKFICFLGSTCEIRRDIIYPDTSRDVKDICKRGVSRSGEGMQ